MENPTYIMQPIANMATVVVFTALLIAVFGGLALLGLVVMPNAALGLMLLVLGMPLLFGLHYITWGWMLSQSRNQPPEDEDR